MIIPEGLYQKIMTKKCILFLGSGASVGSGGPTAQELSSDIYKNINYPEISHNHKLERYAQNLDDAGYRTEMEMIIKERFKHLQPSKEFQCISKIPWRAIYTTNYDDLVEKSYCKETYFECVKDNIDIPKQSYGDNEIPLYKLHGCINEMNRLVVSLADIKKNMKIKKEIINRLSKDMCDCFIFVGYSFEDEVITQLLDKFLDTDQWDSIKEKYMVTPTLNEESKQDLSIYKVKHIKGTGDAFFKSLNDKFKNDHLIKLSRKRSQIKKQPIIKDLEIRTIHTIESCFDYFNTSEEYAFDASNYYRGGNVNWGIIQNNADVNRKVFLEENKRELESQELHYFISEQAEKKKLTKILLTGPAVSGKTTVIYRAAYELTRWEYLTLVYKNQAEYKNGLLADIYNQIRKPIIVMIDNISMFYNEALKMVLEANNRNLPVVFIFSTRNSEWSKYIGDYQKHRIEPFDYNMQMNDYIDNIESGKLVEKLSENNLLKISNNVEKKGLITKFTKTGNLIAIMLEIIDRNNLKESICSEYDTLSDETKEAYGLVSLLYRYEILLKWEILQRALDGKYNFSWDDFCDKILKSDAKGNLFEEEVQGWYYLRGRHRYISELILDVHYKGNYSDEIEGMKLLIKNINENNSEERLIGSVIQKIIIDGSENYEEKFIIEILDCALDKFIYDNNIAYLMHLKGEFLLSCARYSEAISCFDTNVQNGKNEEFSRHSLGKSYYYLSKTKNENSGEFRHLVNQSIDILFEGINTYPKNEYYYGMILNIFDYLRLMNRLSERDFKIEKIVNEKMKNNISEARIKVLKQNKVNNEPIQVQLEED